MKSRFKHKAAWWLRKIADYLEPRPVTKESYVNELTKPYKYGGKIYTPRVLSLAVIDQRDETGDEYHELSIIKAEAQLGVAAQKMIYGYYEAGQDGRPGRTVLRLLILDPK